LRARVKQGSTLSWPVSFKGPALSRSRESAGAQAAAVSYSP
jgi:hypothetical protein